MARDAFELVRKHHLFTGLSDEELRRLDLQAYRCVVEKDEVLVREGAYGSDLFIIESGAVEVVRSAGNGAQQHQIATLEAGANFGELALLDNGPRSATVRALERTELIVIETGTLGRPETKLEREHADIFRNLAKTLSGRLRGTNNVTVAALERELELAEIRVEMANFCAAIILILCGYGFVIRATAGVSDNLATTSLLSVPLLFVFSAIVLLLMRRSPYPWTAYGITLRD
jgi:CRP-like cAMP-binding protein